MPYIFPNKTNVAPCSINQIFFRMNFFQPIWRISIVGMRYKNAGNQKLLGINTNKYQNSTSKYNIIRLDNMKKVYII